MVPGLSESFLSRWRVRLALRNCDSIGVIFYILKLENNSKTVLGGEKKLEVWKLKLAASKIWQCWKAHSPPPDFVSFLASTLFLIDWFFGRLAILILLQGCILIHLILQLDKVLWHLCSFVPSWWMNSKRADPSWVPPSMIFSVKPNRRQ